MSFAKVTPVEEAVYSCLVDLLRGTHGYSIATTLSFCLALALVFFGIYYINLSHEQRVICGLSMLYLVSSTFTLAKQLRDSLMSKVLGVSLLAGTEQWSFQCNFSFFVSLFATLYAAFSMKVDRTIRGFVLIGLSFALSSTVSLAKMVRDHADADYFQALEYDEDNYENMASLVWGSHSLYNQLTWGFFIFDVFAFVNALREFHFNAERTDFLAMGMAFMVYAALFLAKAVRDKDAKDEQLHPSQLHWTMYVSACFLSVGFLFHTIIRLMPITNEKRAFLTLNTVCILSATFNLAKSVRDHEEILWQQHEEHWDLAKFEHICTGTSSLGPYYH